MKIKALVSFVLFIQGQQYSSVDKASGHLYFFASSVKFLTVHAHSSRIRGCEGNLWNQKGKETCSSTVVLLAYYVEEDWFPGRQCWLSDLGFGIMMTTGRKVARAGWGWNTYMLGQTGSENTHFRPPWTQGGCFFNICSTQAGVHKVSLMAAFLVSFIGVFMFLA